MINDLIFFRGRKDSRETILAISIGRSGAKNDSAIAVGRKRQ